jgi:hypothetical protein
MAAVYVWHNVHPQCHQPKLVTEMRVFVLICSSFSALHAFITELHVIQSRAAYGPHSSD